MSYIDDHPGFIPRRKSGPWRFKLDLTATTHLPVSVLPGGLITPMNGEWCTIGPHGSVTVPVGYAWDGCTPKVDVLGLMLVGTPDGRHDIQTGQCMTYYASLFHDALRQYFRYHELSAKQVDLVFLELLRGNITVENALGSFTPSSFPLRRVYHAAVRGYSLIATPKKEVLS
ncbi:MAG: hypothetical protein RhofKO_25960 [Rhodothermales bacterium]